MELPINEKELETIILTLKLTQPTLSNKLWTYKMDYLNKIHKI